MKKVNVNDRGRTPSAQAAQGNQKISGVPLGSSPFSRVAGVTGLVKSVASSSDVSDVLKMDLIDIRSSQPRKYFDPEAHLVLVESIKAKGVLQPVLVRPRPNGRFELIIGERRLRAAKAAGLTAIPVTRRELSDLEASQIALIENMVRQDLSPIELLESVLEILEMTLVRGRSEVLEVCRSTRYSVESDRQLTEAESVVRDLLAEVGLKPPGFVTGYMPILSFPEPVYLAVASGRLDFSKARLLAPQPEAIWSGLLAQVINEGWSKQRLTDELSRIRSQGVGSGVSAVQGEGEVQRVKWRESRLEHLKARYQGRVSLKEAKPGKFSLTLVLDDAQLAAFLKDADFDG